MTISAAESTTKSPLGAAAPVNPASLLPQSTTKTVMKKEMIPSRMSTTKATAFSTRSFRILATLMVITRQVNTAQPLSVFGLFSFRETQTQM